MEKLKNFLKKHDYLLVYFFEIALLAFMIIRVRFGLDLYDETWYVSEPYLASRGAVPYIDIWTQAPGVCFPLAIIYKIFNVLHNNTDGIILFSRYVYVTWMMILVFLSRKLVFGNKKYAKVISMLIITFSAHTLYYIDYNTIGTVYLFISIELLLSDEQKNSKNKQIFYPLISGILLTRGIIGTPYVIVSLMLIVGILLIKKEYKKLCYFLLGVVAFSFTFFAYCFIATNKNPYELFKVYSIYLFGGKNYISAIKRDTFEIFKNVILDFKQAILFFAVCLEIKYRRFKRIHFDKEKFIVVFSLLVVLFGLVLALTRTPENCYRYDFNTVIKYSWFIGPVLCFVLKKNKNVNKTFVKYYTLIAVCTYLVTVFNNVSGTIERAYNLFFLSIVSLFVLVQYINSLKIKYKKIISWLLIFIFSVTMIKCNYSYVYLNDKISNNNYKVNNGIAKGCMISEQRYEIISGVSGYIKKNTMSNDKVFIESYIPYGYLSINGKALTSTSLGVMDTINERYFKYKNEYPTKIIKVSYIPSNTKNEKKIVRWKNVKYLLVNEKNDKNFNISTYIINN